MRRSDMVRAASRREENPKAQTKYAERLCMISHPDVKNSEGHLARTGTEDGRRRDPARNTQTRQVYGLPRIRAHSR